MAGELKCLGTLVSRRGFEGTDGTMCTVKAQLASVLELVSCDCQHVFELRPQIRQDYPLNLSILISGGKETNKDSLSNGE